MTGKSTSKVDDLHDEDHWCFNKSLSDGFVHLKVPQKQGILVGKEEYFFGGRDCSLALLPLIDSIMTTWGWAAKHTDVHCSKILIGKMMTINLDDFVRPDSASSKAMNILLGPLFDVAGYAFAAAAVLAPFSGVNIVTRFEKNKRGRVFRKQAWWTT